LDSSLHCVFFFGVEKYAWPRTLSRVTPTQLTVEERVHGVSYAGGGNSWLEDGASVGSCRSWLPTVWWCCCTSSHNFDLLFWFLLLYYLPGCSRTCHKAPLPAHHCAERGSRRSFSLFLFTRFLVLLLQLLHVLFVASPNQHHPPLLHNQWVALEKI